MTTILGGQFRSLLDRRGLLIAPSAHEERYVLNLEGGAIAVDRHPVRIREVVAIAAEVYGEGVGEHAELLGLYARREDIECPVPDPRVIDWVPHAPEGPGLNPDKWVRLDRWLDDQFLYDDAINLRYDRESI